MNKIIEDKKSKKNKTNNLTKKIYIALILGVIVGVIIHNFLPKGVIRDDYLVNGLFLVVGQGFIKSMQMLVVPLVFASLVCGVMSMGDTKKLGKIGVKALGFYLITTAIAIAVALFIATLLHPGFGMNLTQASDVVKKASQSPNIAQTLLDIIPSNPIKSLAEGNMLQIIVFAIIVGILLAKLGDKASTLSNVMNEVNDLMMDMTMLVMRAAPYGVFCLIAKTFTEIGFSALLDMIVYIFGVLLSLAVQFGVVYMILLKLFSGLNPFVFLKKFFPVASFAFSTATSNATVPLSIKTLSSMGVSKKISSFTIPLGATINMDGTAIMQGAAVVFVANAYGITLSPRDYLIVIATATLASIGTAGIPSVGLVTLSMVFSSVGLPVEGIAMIMGIDRILDMTRTAVNVTGDAVCTTIIAKQGDMFDKDKYYKKEIED